MISQNRLIIFVFNVKIDPPFITRNYSSQKTFCGKQ